MRNRNAIDIDAVFARITPISLALARGVLEALRRHKQAGVPIATWRDGRAVLVPPEEIELKPLEREIAALERRCNRTKSRKRERCDRTGNATKHRAATGGVRRGQG